MNFPWQALVALGKECFAGKLGIHSSSMIISETKKPNLHESPTNFSKKQLAKSAVDRGTSTQSAI